MTRQERAKQFMPFDAMKGLKEALAIREELFTRVEKRELSEEAIEYISSILAMLKVGMEAEVLHYRSNHEIISNGKVTAVDFIYKYLMLNDKKIYFDNIYDINIREI